MLDEGDLENVNRGGVATNENLTGPSGSFVPVMGGKRMALGNLNHHSAFNTQNINAQGRVQPLRAAKKTQGGTSSMFSIIDENLVPSKPVACKRKESQAFTIHEDDGASGTDVTDGARLGSWVSAVTTKTSAAPIERTALPASVMALGVRQPLATLSMSTGSRGISLDVSMDESSPMVLDSSSTESPDSPTLDDLVVGTYGKEIYQHLQQAELRCRPKAGYMRKQPDITTSMRSILVDWLVEVVEEYKLHSETLYLAVNYIDRFLSSMSVLRGKLQLVGTAAMYLAAKFEEIYPPEVSEFVFITDDTYTKKQVLRMEHLILRVLSFEVASPTIMQFLTQYLKHGGACGRTKGLAMYLAEMSLLEVDPYLQYLPSLLAAAAFTLANYTISGGLWPSTLVEFTGYTLEDIRPCMAHLHQTFVGAATHAQQSIREKYKSSKYQMASLIEPPANLPQA
ncbi:LOW QUALITY PROTEIN: cyclin-A2 [Lethenteron reissneri]|uniref:LOW QUALITY PROTEIN: cyclin-A2 n=1 Tax=Lethenteron reissneri TaxID=7753 RepID=UPI002AB7EC90|nr:LOW QUALITY PROTEIN: cyclin-A2 [Lethenteron reissneri]